MTNMKMALQYASYVNIWQTQLWRINLVLFSLVAHYFR